MANRAQPALGADGAESAAAQAQAVSPLAMTENAVNLRTRRWYSHPALFMEGKSIWQIKNSKMCKL